MHKGRISPSINAREGVILLVIDPQQLASGKKQMFQSELVPGSSDAELHRREATQTRIYMILRRTYPKAGLKAKLNSTTMATFILHIPPIKVVQSISKSEPLQTFENFERGLVDT